jgi:hypothetical protein
MEKNLKNNQSQGKFLCEERIMALLSDMVDMLRSINERNKIFLLKTESLLNKRK